MNNAESIKELREKFISAINTFALELRKFIHKFTAVYRARAWLNDNYLILDTETTGIGKDAEIVEISIIDCKGRVKLNTLVKPRNPIPTEATAIHGITNEMVASAPEWRDVYYLFRMIALDKTLVICNADFDVRLIVQSTAISDFARDPYKPRAVCAMRNYANYHGQWDEHRNNFKWQSLANAAKQMNVTIEDTPHRALADCKTTLAVIKAMAGGVK
ncbi:TPA: 3'-5' exonuclease [Yersinia enterocolitica]